MRRVVVTGMGIVSSIGNNTQEVLASLREAKSGIVRAGQICRARLPLPGARRADARSERASVDRRAMRFLGGGAAWNHVAMEQAIRDAGLEENDISNERTGIIMGSGGPSTRTIVEAADITRTKGARSASARSRCRRRCRRPPRRRSPPGSRSRASTIRSRRPARPPTIASATPPRLIQWGKQDMMFAGGCEELDWTLSVLFDAMGAMSSKFNDTPQTASRAYDVNRDGFVIAGGAGVLVLEELEHAKARGAKIYAEIAGYGATSDGYDMVAPSGEGAVRCMRMALEDVQGADRLHQSARHLDAGRRSQGDRGDPRSVRRRSCPPISATKSLTGHSLGAAGVQEAIYSLLMMQNGFICESANIEKLDPAFADMPIVRERARRRDARLRAVELVRLRRHQRLARLQACRRVRADGGAVPGLMHGKRGLIMGVANDHSIAWGIAKALAGTWRRARLHLSGRGARQAREAAGANRLGSTLVLPCDVEDIASVDAVFDDDREAMGHARFPRPRHRLFRQERAEGPLRRHDARRISSARW